MFDDVVAVKCPVCGTIQEIYEGGSYCDVCETWIDSCNMVLDDFSDF